MPTSRRSVSVADPETRATAPRPLASGLAAPSALRSAGGRSARYFVRVAARLILPLVDDDSPDLSWRSALEETARQPALRVVRRDGERGLATAVIRGWQVARGEILGTINADFQHPPELLAAMVAALEGADLVVATRYAHGGTAAGGAHRRLGAHVARLAGRLLVPAIFARVSDPLSGCYLLRRAVIADIELRPLGFKTLIEILARGRAAAIRECPYVMRPRWGGTSKLGARHSLAYLAQLLRLRAAMNRAAPHA